MNLWIFDFDGVLFDTVDETAIVAYNAITDSSHVSRELLLVEYLNLFRANRFHVHLAGDFITLARWCLTHCATPDVVLSRVEFQNILKAEKAPLTRRQNLFFSTRERIVAIDSKTWCALSVPYVPLWDTLKSLNPEYFVILTSKNKNAVVQLCTYFGININPDNIFGAQDGATKAENFESIKNRFNADSYSIIDDSIANLLDLYASISKNIPSKAFLKLHLATWGYLGDQDIVHAKEYGFDVMTQEDLIKALKS